MPIDYTKGKAAQGPGSAAQGSGSGVSLSKVTLTKSAPTVSLSKHSGGAGISGELRVNLNWTSRQPSAGGGLFRRAQRSEDIDLDLGCLYELASGKKGVVQALGNSFRSRNDGPPIISLDGDDRSGQSTEGENLRIDLSRLGEIRRILVFAYIYEGSPNWAAANAVVTLYPLNAVPIEVLLDEVDPSARTCAIALLENVGTDLSVQREVRYIHGTQSALDLAYGWGMKWAPGHK
jgi:tellurite resistance protein TerA